MAFYKQSRTKLSTASRNPLLDSDSPFDLSKTKIASRFERIALDLDRHFLLDDWAVSAYEKFGLNENADGFEDAELKKSHGSFVGAWICLDHNNDHVSKSIGENIDAVYTPDKYVRVAMAVNRELAERRHPGLESKIASGIITDSSMGSIVQASLCTVCANYATDESRFCDHVTKHRGQMFCNADTKWIPIKAGELNRGVSFFENTIITTSDDRIDVVTLLGLTTAGHHSAMKRLAE